MPLRNGITGTVERLRTCLTALVTGWLAVEVCVGVGVGVTTKETRRTKHEGRRRTRKGGKKEVKGRRKQSKKKAIER